MRKIIGGFGVKFRLESGLSAGKHHWPAVDFGPLSDHGQGAAHRATGRRAEHDADGADHGKDHRHDHTAPDADTDTDSYARGGTTKGDGGGGGGGGGKGGGKPTKSDPTPTDPTPVDPTPVDPTPVDPTPVDPTPTDVLLTAFTSGLGGNGVTSGYNIDVVFDGDNWTIDLQQDFVQAAEYISSLIVGDVADYGTVDDIRIVASLLTIDGAGGVLGQAGPTQVRGDSYLPSQGVMRFDIADAETFDAKGLFNDIVLHEMLHTLGFGGMWGYMGLTSGSVATDDMVFTGANAMLAYAATGGTGGVPIETDGAAGTAGAHWDETAFGSELMTGYINGSNTLSQMSVAALEDMGYDTVFDASAPQAPLPQLDDLLFV
ncbi:MAG: hypothetical protein ACJAVS_001156 [Paracoccaceae bacterium]